MEQVGAGERRARQRQIVECAHAAPP
jgi:hypothetical protein